MAEPLAPEQQVLALARPFALLLGGVVVAASGLGWGRDGTVAAAIGVAVSLANVWLLYGLGMRAIRQAGDSDAAQATQAAVGLQGALAAKTVILLALVVVLTSRAAIARSATPFGLGLLVTVFALLAAGLLAPFLVRGPGGGDKGISGGFQSTSSQPIS
jgi:hypothetical protein